MEVAIRNMIDALAGKYKFDGDEAFEFIQWETDVNHVAEFLKMVNAEMPKQVTTSVEKGGAAGGAQQNAEIDEKIATCKKNIELWEKKLSNGKAKDADKQQEKIEKEKAKLAKLEKKAGVKVVERKVEAKAETKKETEKETEKKVEAKAETKEKRIKRFSPVMASQLKKTLGESGLEMNDTMKKEFQQYIEDLSDTHYRESGLADHMRDFVKTKRKTEKKAEAKAEGEGETAPINPKMGTSNAVGGDGPSVHILSLKALQEIGTVASVDPPGNFWDADNGRFVTGPAKDEDEDFIEITFEKKKYVVGENTGRVYEVHETDDVFAGFVGVGKFKGMKMP